MAELLIRAGSQDVQMMRCVFGLDGARGAAWRPDRVVVDAHVPAKTGQLAEVARRSGVPYLVDPQTYYLQDIQDPSDSWAELSFGDPRALSAEQLATTSVQETLVANCVEYQIGAGATAIIPPYVHLERLDDGFVFVQAGLWRCTSAYLSAHQIELPVVAVLALGWRLLDPVGGRRGLAPIWDALQVLRPKEVAVAASKVHLGSKPSERLTDLVMLIEWLSSRYPVIAWQQGLLGEACVAAGAIGYETGIARREHCDLQSAKASRRAPPNGGSRSAPPVYVPRLGRGIPKNSVKEVRVHRALWHQVLCEDPQCCPSGETVLTDARQHAIVSRARDLAALSQIQWSSWRWARLARRSGEGLDLAKKINALADRTPSMTKIDLRALTATRTVAELRRQQRRLRKAA
jgi:hypothetical protein